MSKFWFSQWVSISLLTFIAPFTHGAEPPETKWGGSWEDGEGGIVYVQQHDRILDVTGKDSISVYTMRCLIEKAEENASCTGQGRQLTSGAPFLYETKWRLERGTIIERWSAEFSNNSLVGDLVFKKPRP